MVQFTIQLPIPLISEIQNTAAICTNIVQMSNALKNKNTVRIKAKANKA